MPIELVAARLKLLTQLKMVEGAAEFEAVVTAPKQVPAAYVIPAAERPGKNSLSSGGVSQRVAAGFSVVIAVSNLRDARGRAAMDALKPVRIAIRDQLAAWSPSADFEPIELAPGMLLRMRNGTLWWQDEFLTAYQYWRAQQ